MKLMWSPSSVMLVEHGVDAWIDRRVFTNVADVKRQRNESTGGE
jgi:hypothetical protein